uniref:hypothetical protein n=1 Tax=uncultured Polaribacter sp. TaxID=174711 RepID=UPI0026289586|nr:hypothetical protein [uncultured Polaribacter sp.]
MRNFFVIFLIVFCSACNKFSFTKKENFQQLDTIVDFTSVDTFPSFTVCDSLIDKNKKYNCFRNTIHQKIGEELLTYSLSTKDTIKETIFVDLIIDTKGKVHLEQLNSSEKIKTEFPELDSLLKLSVAKLPKIYPAIKRGIPVTSKYQLPIKIKLEN